jgi:hypothetical protein
MTVRLHNKKWIHFIFIWKKRSARLYIDGMHLHIDHVQIQVSSVLKFN